MSDEPVTVEVEAPVTEAELEAVEVEAEAETEQVETAADAAVKIAEIEAERDIILAEIGAEARIAEAEAFAEAATENQDDNSWRQNIEMQLAAMAETQAAILAQLTPPQSEAPDMNPNSENNPASGASEVTPDSQEPENQEPAPEPPKPRKKSRWI